MSNLIVSVWFTEREGEAVQAFANEVGLETDKFIRQATFYAIQDAQRRTAAHLAALENESRSNEQQDADATQHSGTQVDVERNTDNSESRINQADM